MRIAQERRLEFLREVFRPGLFWQNLLRENYTTLRNCFYFLYVGFNLAA